MLPTRPTLIYDGDCNFCTRWVRRWQPVTGDRVEYLTSQEATDRFPQISPIHFENSVQLVDSQGAAFEGAEAVLQTLALVPGKGLLLWGYLKIPGFARVAEAIYRVIAHNRMGKHQVPDPKHS